MTLEEVVAEQQSPRLAVSHLTRAGDYEDVSFELFPGEILGITGLLGSGRTELALSLFGMTRRDSGEIRIDGEKVGLRSNREAIAAGIAYVPEDRLTLGLVLVQPISSNIVVTVFKTLLGPFGLFDKARRRDVVSRWISELAIKVSDPENPVKTLSGGNQQRVVIAKWLARRPEDFNLGQSDRRGRHRGQGRHLRDRQEARRQWRVGRDDIR